MMLMASKVTIILLDSGLGKKSNNYYRTLFSNFLIYVDWLGNNESLDDPPSVMAGGGVHTAFPPFPSPLNTEALGWQYFYYSTHPFLL